MKHMVIILAILAVAATARAEIVTKTVEYEHDGELLAGHLVHDDAWEGKRPGVVVVHEWRGLGEHAKESARKVAELGYVAFAIDMYGKGVYAKDHKEAAELSGVFREDRSFMRSRARAGLEAMLGTGLVEEDDVAAIGFCFGGSTVLEMARAGMDLDGVVSLHGGLGTPHPEDAKNITASVLVLHGAEDRNIAEDDGEGFRDEMREGDVEDWQMVMFGGVVHSFTNPAAGDDPSSGVAYDARATRRSWQYMDYFFDEIFDN